MALKKLTTLAFAALLLLAGSAQLSASRGGTAGPFPNLHIVPKAQKADKKTGPGFMAFLKRSAAGLGQTFVVAIKNGSQRDSKIAQKAPVKPVARVWVRLGKKSDVRVVLLATSLQPAFFTAMEFHRNSEPAQLGKSSADAVYIRLHIAKTGSLPPPQGAYGAFLPQSAVTAGLKEDYSLLRRILNLLRPGVSLKPQRSPHAQSGVQATLTVGSVGLPTGAGVPRAVPEGAPKATAIGESRAENHLTIDPAQPATLLTHGPMGAGSALRRHRSRDHRSQSV